jgi:hypothetical protein
MEKEAEMKRLSRREVLAAGAGALFALAGGAIVLPRIIWRPEHAIVPLKELTGGDIAQVLDALIDVSGDIERSLIVTEREAHVARIVERAWLELMPPEPLIFSADLSYVQGRVYMRWTTDSPRSYHFAHFRESFEHALLPF